MKLSFYLWLLLVLLLLTFRWMNGTYYACARLNKKQPGIQYFRFKLSYYTLYG